MNNRNFKKLVSIKKIFSLLTIPFIFLAALSAQITQEDADEIVREHMRHKTELFYTVVYAKKGIQKNTTITSRAGEILELDYDCWLYFSHTFREGTSYVIEKTRYLTVNESTGNLFEINAKSDGRFPLPNDFADFAEWRPVAIEEHALANTHWKLAGIVNAQTDILTELEPKNCTICYMLIFVTDSYVMTFSSGNEFNALYEVDYDTNIIHLFNFSGTKVGETGNGQLYADIFIKNTLLLFSLQENELRLYYNDGKNYLLYNYMGVAWEPFIK